MSIFNLYFGYYTRLGQGKDLEGADKLDQLVNTIPKPQRPRSAAVVSSTSTSKGQGDKKENMFLNVSGGGSSDGDQV